MTDEQNNPSSNPLLAELTKLGETLDGATYPGQAWNGPPKRQPRRIIRIFAGALSAAAAVLIVLSLVLHQPEQPAPQRPDSIMKIPTVKMTIPTGFDTRLASRAGSAIPATKGFRIPKTNNVIHSHDLPKSKIGALTIPKFTMPSRQERKQNHETQDRSDVGTGTRCDELSALDCQRQTQG